MSSTQMKEALKTALQIARFTKRLLAEETTKIWKSNAWSELADDLAQSKHYKASVSLPSTCKQIVQVVDVGGKGTSGKTASKRKVDTDVEGQENSNPTSKKRKKDRKRLATESSQ